MRRKFLPHRIFASFTSNVYFLYCCFLIFATVIVEPSAQQFPPAIAGSGKAIRACDSEYRNGTCICHLADGSGKVDLRNVAEQSSKHPITYSASFKTYYLVLCGRMRNSQFQGCNNAASLCETQTKPLPYSLNIGDAHTTRFEWRTYPRPGNNFYTPPRLALVMESTQQQNTRSLIFLSCDEKHRHISLTSRGFENQYDPDGYKLYYNELRGASVCFDAKVKGEDNEDGEDTDKLSSFEIFCIVVVVLIVAYFIGGFLVMTFVYKHEGLQRIPNYSFWHDVVYYKIRGVFDKARTPKNNYQQFQDRDGGGADFVVNSSMDYGQNGATATAGDYSAYNQGY